jgi:hypothetical protein
MSNSLLIQVIILGYIIAYLFYRYGKYQVTEPQFWYIRAFFYIASFANIFCSLLLIYKFYL